MAYPVYSSAVNIPQNSTNRYKKNKGVLIVPGTSNGSAVLKLYEESGGGGGGAEGVSITVNCLARANPFVVPVRIFGTGTISNCTVLELL